MKYEQGSTNTQDALRLANDVVLQESNGMRPPEKGISKVVIVITDGGSNVNASLTIPNANKIKARGFSVFSVGVGSGVNQVDLNAMASNKDDV
jgi:Mg-chelatase subunit ChlD